MPNLSICTMPRLRTIDWLIPFAMRKAEEEKLFKRLGQTLFNNICHISGVNPDRDNPDKVKPLWASSRQDITREEMANSICIKPHLLTFGRALSRFQYRKKRALNTCTLSQAQAMGKRKPCKT